MATAELSHQVDQLKYFISSAPSTWEDPSQIIQRYQLPNGDIVACVLWKNVFYITGTDIIKCLFFRFYAIGRPVKNIKKFEEGVFSDLRNLKPGIDAALEEPRSEFLEFLYKHNCIRTQKKQKVFYWFSVPHDRLFMDALERDLKRESSGQEPATIPTASFQLPMALNGAFLKPPYHQEMLQSAHGSPHFQNAHISSDHLMPPRSNATSNGPDSYGFTSTGIYQENDSFNKMDEWLSGSESHSYSTQDMTTSNAVSVPHYPMNYMNQDDHSLPTPPVGTRGLTSANLLHHQPNSLSCKNLASFSQSNLPPPAMNDSLHDTPNAEFQQSYSISPSHTHSDVTMGAKPAPTAEQDAEMSVTSTPTLLPKAMAESDLAVQSPVLPGLLATPPLNPTQNPFLDGSPNYKQRRRSNIFRSGSSIKCAAQCGIRSATRSDSSTPYMKEHRRIMSGEMVSQRRLATQETFQMNYTGEPIDFMTPVSKHTLPQMLRTQSLEIGMDASLQDGLESMRLHPLEHLVRHHRGSFDSVESFHLQLTHDTSDEAQSILRGVWSLGEEANPSVSFQEAVVDVSESDETTTAVEPAFDTHHFLNFMSNLSQTTSSVQESNENFYVLA